MDDQSGSGRRDAARDGGALHRRRSLADRLAAWGGGVAPAGERLLTEDGLRPVSEIAAGDRLIAYDPEHHISLERIALRVEALAPEPIWEIWFCDDNSAIGARSGDAGRRLRSTRHNRILTASGWRRVDKLRAGDFVSSADADGERLRLQVSQVRRTNEVEPVYAVSISGGQPLILDRVVAQGRASVRVASRLAHRLRDAVRGRRSAPADAMAKFR